MSLGAEIRDDIIFKTLKEELVGPCPYGGELDLTDQNDIPYEKFNLPYISKNNQDEKIMIVQWWFVSVRLYGVRGVPSMP